MIFYFSGTGNSQIAAKQIAEVTRDEVCSINQMLKMACIKNFKSERPLVFIAPTYAWRMPKVVEQWIRRSGFEGNRKAYFILTCGDNCGNAQSYAKMLCQEKGLNFCGLLSVLMPENYVAMFPTPDEAECRDILEKSRVTIANAARMIQNGECFPDTSQSLKNKILSGPVNGIYYPLFVKDKGFRVSDACISCGKCAERCPLNNIDMAEGKPVWKGMCTHCMACIGGCPVEAIEYKTASKGRRRYYIMEE